MRNQIEAADRLGLRAVTINSANRDDWASIEDDLAADRIDVLFVSAQRFANEDSKTWSSGGEALRIALPLIQVILPVGVSFFSFMAVSYIVDVYRGHTTVASWIDVFLYLSFFPHLVAGRSCAPTS